MRASLTGFGAVLLWSLLALLTVATAPVPPLQLNALCFGIGGGVGLVWLIASGGLRALRGVPFSAYAFGTAGLFLYHALYFAAFRLAPPAEAGLIAYLWPLFIVLGSGLLPGERLRLWHIIGALLAFGGAALILGQDLGSGASVPGARLGFALAFLCALTWATYSLGSRRLAKVPTGAVAVSCLATAALSLLVHLALEETAWPGGTGGWAALVLLGAGPVGAAFYLWDLGVKRGNIQALGAASYAAPLLSTLALVAAGMAEPTWRLGVAALAITGGAALAALAPRLSGRSTGG